MTPTGGTAGGKNRRLTQQLGIWTDQAGRWKLWSFHYFPASEWGAAINDQK
jgi:hypothetical protein